MNSVDQYPPITLQGQDYDLQAKTYIMGIINITPDSFSQDGLYHRDRYIELAVNQGRQMAAAGADFLDIGAESTRPGASKVNESEELQRLIPVIEELTKTTEVPISVDTYKPAVAEAALRAGASIINDIWGLKSPDDPGDRMAKIAADYGVPVILMHNKEATSYQNLMEEIIASLKDSLKIACKAGVKEKNIIIDPGIGFGKTYPQNLIVLQNMEQLKSLKRPILLGTSRKSVVGLTLDLPVDQRLEGTIATCVWGIAKGANILRVHDVQAIARAAKMADAIQNSPKN